MTDRELSFDHEVLDAVFERLPLGVIIVSIDGTIFAANAELERLLGYRREELVGQPVEMLVPHATAFDHRAARQEFTQGATTRHMGHGRELTARHRDGHSLPVEIGLSPISVRDRKLIVCTIADTTERRKLEMQLAQTQKLDAVGNLSAGIAHDFKNLLHGILGNAEAARESPDVGPDVSESLDAIVETALRARDLAERILSFSRKGDVARGPIYWEPIIRATIKLFRFSVPATIAIQFKADSDIPCVRAAPADLQQIFMNLLTNAVHAMGHTPGTISLQLSQVAIEGDSASVRLFLAPGQYVCLSVSDQGPGIPPEIASKIFEPFFTTKSPMEGTGLGLSVVNRLAQSLGGAVIVPNAGMAGARFEVYLPVARPIVNN